MNHEPRTRMDLSVAVGTLTFAHPLLAASGTFGAAAEYESFGVLDAFAGVIGKTVTRAPRAGNPPPRLAETAAGLLNTIGLQNPGVEAYCRETLPVLRAHARRVIVNVGGADAGEFAAVVQRLEAEPDVAAYELNLSCPNVAPGGCHAAQDEAEAARVVAAVRAVTDRPLWAKLSPNVTDPGAIAVAAARAGADALSAINSVLGMAVEWRRRRSRLSRRVAGLTGPAIKPIALRVVYRVREALAEAGCPRPIVAIGGIADAEDVLEFLVTGAAAVQLGTINFRRPTAAREILAALPALVAEAGATRLADLIGTLPLAGDR